MDDEAAEGSTALACSAHRGEGDGAEGQIEVCGGCDDGCIVARQVEDNLGKQATSLRTTAPAHGSATVVAETRGDKQGNRRVAGRRMLHDEGGWRGHFGDVAEFGFGNFLRQARGSVWQGAVSGVTLLASRRRRFSDESKGGVQLRQLRGS